MIFPEHLTLFLDEHLDWAGVQEEADADVVEAGLFEDTEGGSFDTLVFLQKNLAKVRYAPAIEIEMTLSIKLSECLDNALLEIW